MTDFILPYLLGMVVGAAFGALIVAMCVAAKRGDAGTAAEGRAE